MRRRDVTSSPCWRMSRLGASRKRGSMIGLSEFTVDTRRGRRLETVPRSPPPDYPCDVLT